MQIASFKSSLVLALGAIPLAAMLAACGGGGGGGGAAPNSSPTGTITISGTVAQGQALSAVSTLADADGLGTISYQWKANDVVIAGATASSYTLTLADVGKTISLVASYTDGLGTHESVTKTVPGTVVFAASNLQGIWTSGLVGGVAASAVVLANGNAWVVVNNSPVQMYTGALQGTASAYSGTGKQYISGSAAVPAVVTFALDAAPVKTTLTGTITPAGQAAQAFSFSYAARYETPALLADIAGTWAGTKSAGTVGVTWTINSSGVLSGSSTSGCTYGGGVAVHSVPVAVGIFDLTLVETCNNLGVDVVKNFAGIVTLNTAKTAANFAFTTSSGSEGDIQSTLKQ
jgi:hypothetical protein